MFHVGGAIRSGKLAVPATSAIALSRRAVLAIPIVSSVSIGAASAMTDGAPRLRRSGYFATLIFAGRSWSFDLRAFGPASRIALDDSEAGHRLRIFNARIAGNRIGTIVFEIPADRDVIKVQVPRLGLRSKATKFEHFVQSGASMVGHDQAGQVRRLLRGFGWRPIGATTIEIDPTGVWVASASGGLTSKDYIAESARLSNVEPGSAPFIDWFVSTPRGWAGMLRANAPQPRQTARTFASGTRRLSIRDQALEELSSLRFADGRSLQAMTGAWMVDIAEGRRKWRGVKTVGGTILESRLNGAPVIAAKLPISPTEHLVEMPQGSARIVGADGEHIISALLGSVSSDSCLLTAGIKSIPIGVPGSDFSEVVFDEHQNYCSAFSKHPRSADSLSTHVLSTGLWGHWYVPMVDARLRVVRARDLLSLNFRFDQVALVRRWSGWRLEPLDQRNPNAPASMAVEFPAQHVMEEAFFFQDPGPRRGLFGRASKTGGMDDTQMVPLDVDRVARGSEKEAKRARDPDYNAATQGKLPSVPGYTTPGAFPDIAEARISGISRLAFKLPPTTGRRRHFPIPFSLDGLTNWSGLELAVAPAALTYFANVSAGDGAMQITANASGDSGDTRLLPLTNPYLIADAHIPEPGTDVATRLTKVQAQALTSSDSNPFATLIELPSRLWLSPDQTARFETATADLSGSPWGKSASSLWQARLRTRQPIEDAAVRAWSPAAVRAVGSPDFDRDYYSRPNDPKRPPFRQDQSTPWGAELRLPLSRKDRHELVSLSVLHGLPIMPRLTDESRLPTDEADKLPSSGTTGRRTGGSSTRGDDSEVRERWLLTEYDASNQGVYAPPAMPVRDLRLSALGGSLDIHGKFEPPAPPYDPPSRLAKVSAFDALTIESWNQSTSLGRDRFVEVVYKGFLFPLGHRAALVKRSERRFFNHPERGVVAYLVQRYFIRINNPSKEFPALNQPNESREFHTSLITFTKTETPDLRDPTSENGRIDAEFLTHPGGKIVLGEGQRGDVFWPRTSDGAGNEFKFEIQLENQAGEMTMPLMFLDNTAAHDAATVEMAIAYYRRLHPEFGLSQNLSLAQHGGAMRRYAPAANPTSTSFATQAWVIDVEGRGDTSGSERFAMNPAMEGKDQPPFFPRISRAYVSLDAVQRFSGRSDRRAVVSYDPLYVRNGFRPPNPSELFLAVHGLAHEESPLENTKSLSPVRMAMNATGNRSGGVAQPNITLVNLSRKIGPVGGQVPPPVPSREEEESPNTSSRANGFAYRYEPAGSSPTTPKGARGGVFSGADFLPEDATLLGIVPLRDIVKAAGIEFAPKLVESVDTAAGEIADQIQTLLRNASEAIGFWDTNDSVTGLLDDLLKQETPLGSVGSLYPGLVTANQRIKNAVSSLDSLSENDGSVEALNSLFDALKDYNEAIEGLVNEIEKTGKDPVPSELTRLFNFLRRDVDQLLDNLAGSLTEQLTREFEDVAQTLLAEAKGEARTWFTATFGPDAYDQLMKLPQPVGKEDINRALEMIASSASDALLYELTGRPLLTLAGEIIELEQAIAQGRSDLRTMVEQSRQIAQSALDAMARQLETQVAGVVCEGAPNEPFARFMAACRELFGDNGTLQIEISKSQQIDKKLAQGLEKLASIEGSFQNSGAGTESQRREVFTVLRRLRRDIGTGRDQLRQLAESLATEQSALAAFLKASDEQLCAPGAVDQLLGSIGRWLSHRAKLTASSFGILRDILIALDALSEPSSSTAQVAKDATASTPAVVLDEAARELAMISAEALGHIDAFSGYNEDLKSALKDAIKKIPKDMLPAGMHARAEKFSNDLDKLGSHLRGAETEFSKIASSTEEHLSQLLEALRSFEGLRIQAEDFIRAEERRILGSVLAPFASMEQAFHNKLLGLLTRAAKPTFSLLTQISQSAKVAAQTITAAQDTADLEVLRLVLNKDLQEMFLPAVPGTGIEAQLGYDVGVLESISAKLNALDGPNSTDLLSWLTEWRDRLAAIGDAPIPIGEYGAVPPLPHGPALSSDHKGKPPALAGTVFAVSGFVDAIAKGRLSELVDIDSLKNELLARFISISLPKIKLSYSFGTDLQPFAGVFRMIDDPSQAEAFGRLDKVAYPKDLTLSFTSSFDVLDPEGAEMEAKGVLQPFTISLFEVISLHFKPIEFDMGSGKNSNLKVEIAEVELGPAVEFIQKMQEMLGFEGTGFFIEPHFNPPGVEVGYMLDLGIVSIGAVTFIDVSLGAGVLLPFDNRPAVYSFYLGRPETPILISSGIYGGGFSLGISSTSRQIISFSMSFEAGAVSGFKAGPLTGKGKITTGIFIARNRTGTRVSGFFVASGSAHIACFSISTCLFVSITQKSGGSMEGRATFTYGFSIGLKEWKYSVPFSKVLPKNFNGNVGSRAALAGDADSSGYESIEAKAKRAGLLARPEAVSILCGPMKVTDGNEISTAVAMDEDWKAYQQYFEGDL